MAIRIVQEQARRAILAALGTGLLLTALPSLAQKVWESDQPLRSKVGRVHVHMEKNFARNADPGAFFVSARDNETSVSGIFRGVCAEVVAADIKLSDARKVDLAPFARSGRGEDLPIAPTVRAMRESLVQQCDQLQVIRLTFDAINERNTDYSYAGTLMRSNGWRLRDGKIATDYDGAYVFSLNMRSPFSPAGIRYKGGCEQEPTLLLEPQYQNNTERALADPIPMNEFMFIAPRIATAYEAECPGVTQLRFALNPMPEEYLCKAEGDCFLRVNATPTAEDPWSISTEEFKVKKYYHPITDARDMFEVLAAGRFDILRDYDGFFGFYFENWFGAYSDMCKAHIRSPVGRKIQVVERTYDNGVLVNEDFGPERLIWIESAYADDYDRYFGSSKPWATMYVLGKVMKQQDTLRNSVNAVFSSFGFLTGNIDQLEGLTRNHCTDDRLLTAQDNMIRYARKQPAADTQKYPTSKKPLVKYADNGPSAPAFTARVQEERRKAEQAIRERNQVGTIEDWQRRQAKIQAEIRQRNGTAPSAPARTAPDAPAAKKSPGAFQTRNELIQDQKARVNAKMQEFQQKMMQATDSGERQALQNEMQNYFSTIQQEMRKELEAFDKQQQ